MCKILLSMPLSIAHFLLDQMLSSLRSTFTYGVGCHHRGMLPNIAQKSLGTRVHCVLQVGRDCMNILSSGNYKAMDAAQRESFHRIFWTSSIIIQ